MKVSAIPLTVTAIFVAFSMSAWSTPVIQNGDFEAVQIGAPFVSTNPADIPNWTHTGVAGDGLLWHIGYVDSGGSITVAGSGNQFVTAGGGGGFGTATWTTTITGLVSGSSYIVGFKMASETSASQTLTVDVPVGSTTLAQAFSAGPSPANYWRSWESKSYTFQSNTTGSGTLRFTASTVNDVGLDSVSISDVPTGVPEPATWGLLLSGIAACAMRIRRRA
jgi:hypothetical protein